MIGALTHTPSISREASAPDETSLPRAAPGLARAFLAGLEPDARGGDEPIALPDNRALRVVLRELQVRGRVELADAKEIIAKAGRLSVTEQRAIGQTLEVVEARGGVAPSAAEWLLGHLTDERSARAAEIRRAAISSAAFTTLSVASGGMSVAAATVLMGLSFGSEPISSAALALTTIFGVSSLYGCAKIAVNNAVDAGTYGRED